MRPCGFYAELRKTTKKKKKEKQRNCLDNPYRSFVKFKTLEFFIAKN